MLEHRAALMRLAQHALDEVRREQQRELPDEERKPLKKSRWPLLKRSDTLKDEDKMKLSQIQKLNLPVYRGYLLKESLLEIFDAPDRAPAEREMASWLSWASRSRLRHFVRSARTVRKHLSASARRHERTRMVSNNDKTTHACHPAPACARHAR